MPSFAAFTNMLGPRTATALVYDDDEGVPLAIDGDLITSLGAYYVTADGLRIGYAQLPQPLVGNFSIADGAVVTTDVLLDSDGDELAYFEPF